jgi:hypothetical protein
MSCDNSEYLYCYICASWNVGCVFWQCEWRWTLVQCKSFQCKFIKPCFVEVRWVVPKGGYSLQRCNVKRNGCCNHVWPVRLPELNPNTSCSAVFIVKTCNHAIRKMWLQQPLRCTLQRCSEYPPLHCSVIVSTRPKIEKYGWTKGQSFLLYVFS